ncbi:MAG: SMR family transporter [Ornithinibacter sp.]
MEWWWLLAAVLFQWVQVAAIRASNGLRSPSWALLTFVAMITSVGCISVALSLGLTLALAYGIWTGAGVSLAAITGAVVFGDTLDRRQTLGLALVLVGVALLQIGQAV